MGRKGKAPKQRRRRLDPQEAAVRTFLERSKVLSDDAIEEVLDCNHISDVLTGFGAVYEATVNFASGQESNLVVKMLKLSECSSSEDDLRRKQSYRVEANFYEKGHAEQMNACGAKCPSVVAVEFSDDDSHLFLCMTKLAGIPPHALSELQAQSALRWLARLHANYWGWRADEAILKGGLQCHGCFWYLDARTVESMDIPSAGWQGRLRLAARAIDLRLKADRFQTVVHGDAKAENMLFTGCAADGFNVGFCDFQYIGKAHFAKDLAYCFLCLERDVYQESHTTLLNYYRLRLSELLELQGDVPPTLHELQITYGLCVCDLARWMAGRGWLGFEATLRERCMSTLDAIDGGDLLDSEEAYVDKIFKTFPV